MKLPFQIGTGNSQLYLIGCTLLHSITAEGTATWSNLGFNILPTDTETKDCTGWGSVHLPLIEWSTLSTCELQWHSSGVIKNMLWCSVLFPLSWRGWHPKAAKITKVHPGSDQGNLEQAYCNSRMVTNACLSTTMTFRFSVHLFLFVCLLGLVVWWRSGEAQQWPV